MDRFLKNLDVFRRMPDELTEASIGGGSLTLLSTVICVILFFFETWNYLSVETSREIIIDPHSEDNLIINFDVTLFELPCKYASVDIWDAFGTERQNVTSSTIKKTRLDINLLEGNFVDNSDKRIKHDTHFDDVEYIEDGQYSHQFNARTWKKGLMHQEYTFVNFFVPWCPWSRRLAPIWDEAAKNLDKMSWRDIGVTTDMIRLNCQTNARVCRSERVMAFPTMRLYKRDQPVWPEYSGDRTSAGISKWLLDTVSHPIVQEHHTFENFTDRGCRVKGQIEAPRVPGNFHLEARSTVHSIDSTMTNVSHLVHHLSFGETPKAEFLAALPAEDKERIHPLNGRVFDVDHMHNAPHHFIKVIPTIMELRQSGTLRKEEGYIQVAQNRIAQYAETEVPEAKFTYDLSPMGMYITQKGTHWYTYLTSICALIGGMFTVISMVKMFCDKTSKQFKTRARKLG